MKVRVEDIKDVKDIEFVIEKGGEEVLSDFLTNLLEFALGKLSSAMNNPVVSSGAKLLGVSDGIISFLKSIKNSPLWLFLKPKIKNEIKKFFLNASYSAVGMDFGKFKLKVNIKGEGLQ